MEVTKEQLAEILEKHKKWLNDDECGERANLSGANLSYADLSGVKANVYTTGFYLACPEEGAFIGFKKCRGERIVKLFIPEDAKRSSATSRKCRCSKASVLDIVNQDGTHPDTAVSGRLAVFTYRVGETVEVPDFDEDRWEECAAGIHFFLTRAEAEEYDV